MRSVEGDDRTPIAGCVFQMGVCPSSIISPYSSFLGRMYQATGGTSRVQTVDQFLALPCLWTNICEIIETEERLAQVYLKQLEQNGIS